VGKVLGDPHDKGQILLVFAPNMTSRLDRLSGHRRPYHGSMGFTAMVNTSGGSPGEWEPIVVSAVGPLAASDPVEVIT
jgi:hypothetical protein